MEIKTKRLLLRQWCQQDYLMFARLNADPIVMEYFPATLTEQESNAMADRLAAMILKQGWGFWALELLDQEKFIGFVGLNRPAYNLPVTPCVEIGWRLAKEYWGSGYATEAARAVLDFSFQTLKLDRVYSFTAIPNTKSQAVMERLNMHNTQSNFEHPLVPIESPLREHVLYMIDRQSWLKQK